MNLSDHEHDVPEEFEQHVQRKSVVFICTSYIAKLAFAYNQGDPRTTLVPTYGVGRVVVN